MSRVARWRSPFILLAKRLTTKGRGRERARAGVPLCSPSQQELALLFSERVCRLCDCNLVCLRAYVRVRERESMPACAYASCACGCQAASARFALPLRRQISLAISFAQPIIASSPFRIARPTSACLSLRLWPRCLPLCTCCPSSFYMEGLLCCVAAKRLL